VDRRDEREEERDDRSSGDGIEPHCVDRTAADERLTIEDAVSSVADRARMSLRTSRWRSSESSERSKTSSSTLAATA
jgi:hypothetical protein